MYVCCVDSTHVDTDTQCFIAVLRVFNDSCPACTSGVLTVHTWTQTYSALLQCYVSLMTAVQCVRLLCWQYTRGHRHTVLYCSVTCLWWQLSGVYVCCVDSTHVDTDIQCFIAVLRVFNDSCPVCTSAVLTVHTWTQTHSALLQCYVSLMTVVRCVRLLCGQYTRGHRHTVLYCSVTCL